MVLAVTALLSATFCAHILRSVLDSAMQSHSEILGKVQYMVIRQKRRYLVEIMDSQKSVGGPDESVLLRGRWFGTGNK